MARLKNLKFNLKLITLLLPLLVFGLVAGGVMAQERSSAVTVTLPGLVPGQIVAGQVELAPQIEAPAPPVRVEYYLDEQRLASLDRPPYSFLWDTSLASAGVHILRVKVSDRAGNEGQYQLGLQVAGPLTFTIPPLAQQEIALGQEVTLQIPTEPETRVKQVEVFLNDRLIASEARPSYRFSFDSGPYSPGEYTLMIRVEDEAGQTVRASYPLVIVDKTAEMSWPDRLKALWGTWGSWIKRGFAILFIIIILALLIGATTTMGTASLRRWRKGRQQTEGRLVIKNRGNIRSRYEVQVNDPVGVLSFQLGLNEVYRQAGPLPAKPAPVAVPLQAAPVAATVPLASAGPGSLPIPAGVVPVQANGHSLTGQIESGSRTVQETAGIARLVISMINLVAGVLPTALGRPLRVLAQALYRPLMALNRLVMLPLRLIGIGKQISTKSAKMAQARQATPLPGGTSPAPVIMSPLMANSQRAVQPIPIGQGGNGAASLAVPQPGPEPILVGAANEAITPFLEPGQSFSFDLVIKPLNPRQGGDYTFTVTSRSLAQPEPRARTEQQRIKVKAVSPLGWMLPFLATLLMGVVVLSLLIIAVILIASLIFWL